MPDGQRAAMKAAEHQAESHLLRDRVTAAVGDRYLIEQEVGRGGMAVVLGESLAAEAETGAAETGFHVCSMKARTLGSARRRVW